MKVKKLKEVSQKSFDDIYNKTVVKPKESWEEIFEETIRNQHYYTLSKSFWYIGDFSTAKVVAAGGNVDECSPLNAKDWIGLNVMEIGKMFHPLDMPKMQAYTVFMADFLAKKTQKQRDNIRISMLFRLINSEKKYTWSILQYPKMVYEKGIPKYVFCLISDYTHLLEKPKCTMYISDNSKKEHTLFYCDEEKVNLKIFKPAKELSQREIELIKLLAKGLISKEIAGIMGISKNTVENHKQNIFSKTGSRNLAELVAFAHINGLNL